MLPEPIAVTLQVIDALEQVGAAYVIGGSLASTIHGVVRTTLDTDVVADLTLQQAQPFADLLADAFYLDIDTIRHAIRTHSSFNAIHLATMFKVDIFITKDRPFDRQQLDRRQAWVVDPDSGRTIYVATPEDTVLTKLVWYRLGGEVSDRQWRDVLGVLAVQGDRLDQVYMSEGGLMARRGACATGTDRKTAAVRRWTDCRCCGHEWLEPGDVQWRRLCCVSRPAVGGLARDLRAGDQIREMLLISRAGGPKLTRADQPGSAKASRYAWIRQHAS